MEHQSTEWENKIRFRDYLIRHPDVAQTYADLKRSLAAQFSLDPQAYQRGKLAFVQQVLQKAT
jgi:GrpB-like predicted nucleotidyltransferase (UPF0157 family)